MVNSGKRKYTKKTIMKGGAISFTLIGFTSINRNGKDLPAPEPIIVNGISLLTFIDQSRDTFFNTFRHVKFSKSCSKCYILDGKPYQLIYDNSNGNVYQYAVYEFNRFRAVVQNSLMSDEAVSELLNVSLKMLNSITYPNVNSNPAYKEWERQLYDAIINGQISIEQIYNFLYQDGDNHKPFKAGKYVSNFWTKFHQKYEREFF